jgi:O-antigen/teichoic acid export membrane protein
MNTSTKHEETGVALPTAGSVRPVDAPAPKPRFLTSVTTVLSGQAALALVAVLSEITMARLAGPTARGQISLCVMAIAFGALIGGLGGDIPIVIWTADRKRKVSSWFTAILVWGAMGCCACVALWCAVFVKWQVGFLRGVTPGLAKFILLTIPFSVLINYLAAVLTGSEWFRELMGITLARNLSCLGIFVVLAFAVARSAESYMAAYLIGTIVGVIAAAALLRRVIFERMEMPSGGREFWSGLGVGLRGQVGNVAAFFNYRLDVFIVNYFLNPTEVGLYAIGVAVSEALWQIPQAVAMTLFPRTARTLNEGASVFTCLIMRQVFVVSVVCASVLAVASPWAVPLVFGARFHASIAVIWWLLPGTVAMSVAKVAASDLAGRAKTGYASAFGIVAFGVTVILDLVLIPRMGIRGAALASSVAYFVNGVLLLRALKRELGVRWVELFVPSRGELAGYGRAWNLLTTRLPRWKRAEAQ